MDLAKLISIVKALIPTRKVAVYILAAVAALLATQLKLSESELKDAYCKDGVVLTK